MHEARPVPNSRSTADVKHFGNRAHGRHCCRRSSQTGV
ncbi:hypothetical protein PAMC26510_17040 [Caballeronia sordidicola]|uniref:Uncharacterized protein n=1 Tax=Caballeronia sordidicola TaxID=196367 RepID=A0A242MTD1_CABSO|nr:hypothetical protein PAMC26510_17040 [Caballeronia sordidicola]